MCRRRSLQIGRSLRQTASPPTRNVVSVGTNVAKKRRHVAQRARPVPLVGFVERKLKNTFAFADQHAQKGESRQVAWQKRGACGRLERIARDDYELAKPLGSQICKFHDFKRIEVYDQNIQSLFGQLLASRIVARISLWLQTTSSTFFFNLLTK